MPKSRDEEIYIEQQTDDPWEAKPLTLEGTARLVVLLTRLTDDMARKAQVEALLAMEAGQAPVDRPLWAALANVMGEDELKELLSIITRKSPAWVKRNYRLLNAARAIRQFFDNEDLGEVLKNLTGTAPIQTEAVSGLDELLTDSSVSTGEP